MKIFGDYVTLIYQKPDGERNIRERVELIKYLPEKKTVRIRKTNNPGEKRKGYIFPEDLAIPNGSELNKVGKREYELIIILEQNETNQV